MALLPMIFHELIGLADGIKMALSIVLIAPLAFCMGMPFPIGLKRLADSRQRIQPYGRSPVSIAVAGILVIALLYIALLPIIFHELIGLADGIKMALSIVLIAPLAFCMGMPFPIGLKRLADSAPDFIPWAWGINGFASVMSAALATLLAIEFGFSAVVVLALGLYASAAAIIRD